MHQLAGKIIFLTGGSRSIGFECAKKYMEAGARVVVVANDAASIAETMDVLGDEHFAIYCDVSKSEEVALAIYQTLQRFGKIDVIHNNAGITGPSTALHDTDVIEWEQLFDVNLKSILFTTKFGLDALKRSKGCILNTSSLVGNIGQENHAAYSATKGAINALTKSMALDYAPFSIRVNAVAPAGVWTQMLREWIAEQPDPVKIMEHLDAIHPLGYCPQGDEIADACVFLISEKARFITGNIMAVSGGAELGYRRQF
jgi:meso-butanediol dehydrogenase/(S,S)-butanediol dehydrogenase/diacetyl reductase